MVRQEIFLNEPGHYSLNNAFQVLIVNHPVSSGCKVESVCLKVEAVNTHRDRPTVRLINAVT